MKNTELLLSRRWIIKSEDRDLYYQIKDNAKSLRPLFLDKAGFSLMIHPLFIRLDKVPGKSEPWMGITSFTTVKEYQMFCFLLIYLEDKDANEPFVLSDVCEFIQGELKEDQDVWLQFKMRKMLVNVLRFAMDEKLITLSDGVSENFIQDAHTEVLFCNAGLSRYFMRSFNTDIYKWQSSRDVRFNEWHELTEVDRGDVRKYRIYRRLLLSPGIYQEDLKNDDFIYLKNYQKRIEYDLNKFFNCDLHLYKGGCFAVLEDDVRIGEVFPKQNALDELVACCCRGISQELSSHSELLNDQEIYILVVDMFKQKLRRIITQQLSYIPRTYRQKKIDILVDEVMERMLYLGFISIEEAMVYVYPVIGLARGEYRNEEGE